MRSRKLGKMDEPSQLLIRSALHDLANVLAGVRGILDISDPERPLSPRDRERLDAVLEEGMTTLERSRSLVLGTLPDPALEPGEEWRQQLQEQLAPMGVLYKCAITVAFEEGAGAQLWPGELLRGYVRSLTRLALPYVHDGRLRITCGAGPQGWSLSWTPVALFPESLAQGAAGKHLDISTRWALSTGEAQAAVCSWADGVLRAGIPRT